MGVSQELMTRKGTSSAGDVGRRGWDEDGSLHVYKTDRPSFAWLALPKVMSGMRNISDLIYILIVCWSCNATPKAFYNGFLLPNTCTDGSKGSNVRF